MGECLIIRGGGGTDTSDATATASVVLSGYTCYVNDQLIAGSMPVQTLNQKLGAGGSVTIPAGYYDGSSSVISTSTLAEETAANAASSHILSGYNAWVNGSKVNGSMTNRGNISHSLAANGSYTVPAGWHVGGGRVTQSLTTQGAKTVTPKTTNQTACAASRWTTGNIVVLGSSNLTAGNIRNGVWIFGVLGNFTGWVDATSRQFVLSAVGAQSSGGPASCVYVPNFGSYYVGNWNYIWTKAVVDMYRNASQWVWFQTNSGGPAHGADGTHSSTGWIWSGGWISGTAGTELKFELKSSLKNRWIYGMTTASSTSAWGMGLGAIVWLSM